MSSKLPDAPGLWVLRRVVGGGCELVALLVGLVFAGPAVAASCCVGNTSAFPTRLGPTERALVGVSVGGNVAVARWDNERKVRSSGAARQRLLATLGGTLRVSPKVQVGLTVPLQWTHASTDSLSAFGGGLGDISLFTIWIPIDERVGFKGYRAPPVPVFSVGARFPSGTAWSKSEKPLFADVTGFPNSAVQLRCQIERSKAPYPWAISVTGELSVGAEHLEPAIVVAGILGKALGDNWNLSGILTYTERWIVDQGSTANTRFAVRGIYAKPTRFRWFAELNSDLPVPGLGRSTDVQLGAQVGVALVR